MIVLFIGPPGSGKGTQAKILSDKFGFEHISTGDLLRKEIELKTVLGLQAKDIIENGGLISDDIILDLVDNVFAGDSSKFILDGCPRTLNQAMMLEEILKKHGKKVDLVLDFIVDFDRLVERISGRFSCQECGELYHLIANPPKIEGVCDRCGGIEFKQRSDDKEEVLKDRIDLFKKESIPVLDYYRERNVLAPIQGDSNLEEVSSQLRDKLGIE